MRFSLLSVAAAFAGLASAQFIGTPPKDQADGLAVRTPALDTQVPKGKPYEITWDNDIDKSGTVTIVLLRGPSENVLDLAPIAQQVPNSGSFSWTPKSDLEVDTTHYGIRVTLDTSGQFQWSAQFGISGGSSEGGEETTTSAAGGYPTVPETSAVTSEAPQPTTSVKSSATAVPPSPSSSASVPLYLTTTLQVTTCLSGSSASAPTYPAGTGAPAPSGAAPPAPPAAPPAGGAGGAAPSGTVPGAPAPPAESSPIQTGAAGKTVAISGVAAVAAVFAFAL